MAAVVSAAFALPLAALQAWSDSVWLLPAYALRGLAIYVSDLRVTGTIDGDDRRLAQKRLPRRRAWLAAILQNVPRGSRFAARRPRLFDASRRIHGLELARLGPLVVHDTYVGMSESAVEVLGNFGLRVPKIWRQSPASVRMV